MVLLIVFVQGLSVSRSSRRGTGPVLAEDIHAAVSARQSFDANVATSVTTTRTSSTDTGTATAATVRPTVSVSSFTRPHVASLSVRAEARGVETPANINLSVRSPLLLCFVFFILLKQLWLLNAERDANACFERDLLRLEQFKSAFACTIVQERCAISSMTLSQFHLSISLFDMFMVI